MRMKAKKKSATAIVANAKGATLGFATAGIAIVAMSRVQGSGAGVQHFEAKSDVEFEILNPEP
jgi:hypothetical protein